MRPIQTSLYKPQHCCLFSLFLGLFTTLSTAVQAQAPTNGTNASDSIRISKIEQAIKRFNGITITGFMEPEFQVGQSKGEASFAGGNFNATSNNRFLIRRGRLRTIYNVISKDSFPVLDMVFEPEITQRGVSLNEINGRLYENRWHLFSVSAGMLVRPFGNEVTYPTRKYESPERGRMSQTLMRGEVDLGMALNFEPKAKNHPLRYIKASVGIFNGQGLTAPGEYDSFKDIIARVALLPLPVSKQFTISGGVSVLNGGIEENNRFIYHTVVQNGKHQNQVDSSLDNIGKKAPRRYYGADLQLKYNYGKGAATELRFEYWKGTQSASGSSSETPVALLTEPYYIRHFNGMFLYFIQTLTPKHQIVFKYDTYDPNSDVKGGEIGAAGANLGAADIKYNTLGMGYHYYWNNNIRLTFWYDVVHNESTLLNGYTSDVKDNVFTCRLQLRF